VTLGPEERHKARQIMKAQRITYKEALSIMSRSAAVKRAQHIVRRALAQERTKPLSERRLEPPPDNVWYNRD